MRAFWIIYWTIVLAMGYAVAGDDLRFVKHVPEGASIQYVVRGNVVQSVGLRPGSYEIIVRRLGRTGE